MKRYIIRAIKCFIYFTVLMSAILFVLAKLGIVGSDIDSLFRDGMGSVWKILACFAAISAIYPKFKYCSRVVAAEGGMEQNSEAIVSYFESKGYSLEVNETEKMMFRLCSTAGRLSRMFEDAITITPDILGFKMEGMSKDIIKLNLGLQNVFEKHKVI